MEGETPFSLLPRFLLLHTRHRRRPTRFARRAPPPNLTYTKCSPMFVFTLWECGCAQNSVPVCGRPGRPYSTLAIQNHTPSLHFCLHFLLHLPKSTKKCRKSVAKVKQTVVSHIVGTWLCSKHRASAGSGTPVPHLSHGVKYTVLHFYYAFTTLFVDFPYTLTTLFLHFDYTLITL